MIIELFIFMITGSIHVYRSLLGGFITPNPLGWVLKKIFSFGMIKNDIYAGVANKQNAPFYKLCPKTQPLHTPNGQKWFWCILSLSNFFLDNWLRYSITAGITNVLPYKTKPNVLKFSLVI